MLCENYNYIFNYNCKIIFFAEISINTSKKSQKIVIPTAITFSDIIVDIIYILDILQVLHSIETSEKFTVNVVP